MAIALKRAYDPPSIGDGTRILVDRLWPRGLKKDSAQIDLWLKEAAPSTDLRTWFAHDPIKWRTFKARYFRELADHPEVLSELLRRARRGNITLVYSARDTRYNNAVALKAFVETKLHPDHK